MEVLNRCRAAAVAGGNDSPAEYGDVAIDASGGAVDLYDAAVSATTDLFESVANFFSGD